MFIKRLPILIFLFIAALAVGGCMLPGNGSELWFYANSNINELNNLPLKPSHFLYLQSDGKYTCDFGIFEYGEWKRDGNKIHLTSGNRDLTVLQVIHEDDKRMQLSMKGFIADFESKPLTVGDKGNPFSIEKNKWRVPATQKEDERQLRSRLYNHCAFWEAYFDWGIENDLQTLDVRSTPTPIKIYGNGLGLKQYEDLPAVWRSYFYDSTDCKQATEILKHEFRKHDIEWAKSDNDYVIFRSAFKQLQQFLQ